MSRNMKYFTAWFIASIVAMAGFFGIPAILKPTPVAAATTSNTCILTYAVKDGNAITITVCEQNFNFNVNDAANGTLGDVTLPPVPTPTVTVPGPTVRVPPVTKNIKVPRATKTIKVPGPTTTVRVPGKTKTVRPPSRTVTATVTRQLAPVRVTITPSPRVVYRTQPAKTSVRTVVKRIAIGALVTLALTALGILALFLGYYLGTKDAYRKDNTFMSNLLERAKYRPERSN